MRTIVPSEGNSDQGSLWIHRFQGTKVAKKRTRQRPELLVMASSLFIVKTANTKKEEKKK